MRRRAGGIPCTALRGLLDTDVYRIRLSVSALSRQSLWQRAGQACVCSKSVASLASHLGNHKDVVSYVNGGRLPADGELETDGRVKCLGRDPYFDQVKCRSEPACDRYEVI